MNQKRLRKKLFNTLALTFLPIVSHSVMAASASTPVPQKALSAAAMKNLQTQMTTILSGKETRTEAEKKMSGGIWGLVKSTSGGAATSLSANQKMLMNMNDKGVLVDMRGEVSEPLLKKIQQLGGEVINSSDRYGELRARLPVSAIERLAEDKKVTNIRPADQAITHKVNASEGVEAHRLDEILAQFGVDGSGVSIGVLSDSVRGLEDRQETEDLPNVTVLPGQDGIAGDGSDIGEGTAMLEIVHDLAPGANLLFATAFGGQASFAENILALREAGADIIVDDVFFFAEPAFQDGIIAQAVNRVVEDGALYFSSAGNSGNQNDGTSGTFEGDFNGINAFGEVVHDFGDGSGTVTLVNASPGSPITLRWNDPIGASDNDYDLFVIVNGQVVDSSTNVQDGNDDPFEIVGPPPSGAQLVVVRRDGAENRVIHLSTNRGRLNLSTESEITGHAAAERGIAVAAVNVATAQGAAFVGGASNPVETFSSDGPRRVFFDEDGTPLSNDLTSNGGEVRLVPQIAAADGVSTAQPGFERFFGTSAAAPHAAAIAGVLLSARPDASGDEILNAMFSTALDIEEPDFDRDSGNGIIDGVAALELLCEDGGCNFDDGNDPGDGDNGDDGNEDDNEGDNNVFTNEQSVDIPDATLGGVESVIDVNRAGDAGRINVKADITHTFRGDLRITIFAPNGASAQIVQPRRNDGRDNLSLSVDLNATGIAAQGEWRLRVEDVFRRDTGTLNNWSITFIE